MSAYVIQRILLMLLTLLGMSIIIFVLLRLVPGNIVDIMFDSAGFVDPSEKASIEKELGLDLPIYQQYFDLLLQYHKLMKAYNSTYSNLLTLSVHLY